MLCGGTQVKNRSMPELPLPVTKVIDLIWFSPFQFVHVMELKYVGVHYQCVGPMAVLKNTFESYVTLASFDRVP